MKIREFKAEDAEFCFKVRSNVYIQKFYNELSLKEIASCVNTYMPKDFIHMAKKVEFFIVEKNDLPIGFFTIKRINQNKAEIPLIYIDLNHQGKGIGKICIHFIENWITSNWKEVNRLFLDTIIPKNNRGFYEKVGFVPIKETLCEFQGLEIKALRLSKKLNF